MKKTKKADQTGGGGGNVKLTTPDFPGEEINIVLDRKMKGKRRRSKFKTERVKPLRA